MKRPVDSKDKIEPDHVSAEKSSCDTNFAQTTHINKLKQFHALRRSPWRRLLLKTYIRFIKLRGEPRQIALGFAMGLFVAVSPTMGVQVGLAIFIAILFKLSKLAAAIAVWITNPLTAPFIYGLTYLIGARILGLGTLRELMGEPNLSTLVHALKKAPELLAAMTIGGIIIGIPLAVAGYYIAFAAVMQYQQRLKAKVEVQKNRLRLKKDHLKEKVQQQKELLRLKRENSKKKREQRKKGRKKKNR